MLLTGGLIVSTLPIANERALFAPFGEEELELPTAYAIFMQTGYGPRHGGGRRVGRPRVPRPAETPEAPPVAFAARFPNEPAEIGNNPIAPPEAPRNALRNGARPLSPLSPSSTIGPPAFASTDEEENPNPTSPAPEPETWVTMIVGFGFIGAMLRRKRRKAQRAAVLTGS